MTHTNSTYRTLGATGLRVSPLALGTMTFGTEWGWGTERPVAERLLDLYLDRGGNFIDTADLYTQGTSETWVGEMVKDRGIRDRVVVATKYSYCTEPGNPNAGGNGRKNMMRALEGSLRRLQTDYVDLYLLHTWDGVTPVEEVLRTFDDVIRSGKVRHVGLSDVPAWYASRAITLAERHGMEPISTLQLEYSLLERNLEFEFVPMAQALRTGIMAWSPLASGLLSGKHKPSQLAKGRLEAMRTSTNPAFAKLRDPSVWNTVEALEQVSDEVNRPMAQVALNWVTHRPAVDSVIVGATRTDQLESNLDALDFELPETLRARQDRATASARPFPYSFFEGEIQQMIHGGTKVTGAGWNR